MKTAKRLILVALCTFMLVGCEDTFHLQYCTPDVELLKVYSSDGRVEYVLYKTARGDRRRISPRYPAQEYELALKQCNAGRNQ